MEREPTGPRRRVASRLGSRLARRRVYPGGMPRALLALCICLAVSACTRLPQGSRPAPTAAVQADAGAEAIVKPLRKQSDLATCRSLIAPLNAYLNQHPEQRPAPLTQQDQKYFKQHLRLDDDELVEVGSPTFTMLDAHHLHQCLLLRAAARALQLEGRRRAVRAEMAFGWVMRQVRLQESNDEPAPPGAVLGRGWGSDRERALLFLALLEQLDIPGCMLVLPGAIPWVPGALCDGAVLLFDTRLGVPLPSSGEPQAPASPGKGIATFNQLRANPELLQALPNYDVTPEQARRAEVQVVCSLSSCSMRMRQLEKWLAGSVRLGQSPVVLQARFRQSLEGSDVQFWAPASGPAPARLLRAFLALDEGGADKSRWRKRQFELTLTPWSALPAQIESLPANVYLGRKLREEYEKPFLSVYMEAGGPSDLLLRGHLEDAVGRLVERLDKVRHERELARQETDLAAAFSRWCQEALKALEDLLVANRQATTEDTPANRAALAEAEKHMVPLSVERKLQEFEAWRHGLWRAQEEVLSARRQVSASDSPETRTILKEAEQDLQKVAARRKDQKPMLFLIEQRAAPLAAALTYLLALTKHEQAERTQARLDSSADKPEADTTSARHAWQSAADWWKKVLDADPPPSAEAAARLALARALAALGQKEAAADVLKSASDKVTGWNQQAVRYRLRQLDGK